LDKSALVNTIEELLTDYPYLERAQVGIGGF
jgi:uncharacterized protein (DUF433 family)